MSPNVHHKPTLNFKQLEGLATVKTGELWLSEKRVEDEVGDLWRVHDNLYDLTTFIKSHPGGPMWLELTKGTDITEAFEAHHITTLAEEVLKKFFVRKASKARNSPFTFEENGFYRTLKRNIRPALKNISNDISKSSDLIIDSLCLGTFLFGILASAFSSFSCGIISGLLLTFTVIAAHNYFHRRDNFRMYYFNLSLMDFREWRITHGLSHHLFPNTIYDIEVTAWKPYIQYLPGKKSLLVKYGSYCYVLYLWTCLYLLSFINRSVEIYRKKSVSYMNLPDLIPFVLPLAMYIFSGATIIATVKMWVFIIMFASFVFGAIGFNAAHHHPDIFHDGDAPRAKIIDWGMHQLDAVSDRHEITGNKFLVLTTFGDHALHHMFPTLDHATLQYLYPVFKKTMMEFGVDLRMKSQIELVIGQFQQLSKETPNPIPPGSFSKNK